MKNIFFNRKSRITTFAMTLRVTNKLKEFSQKNIIRKFFLYATLYTNETSGVFT